MKRIFLSVLACFLITLCPAQQGTKPIIIEGRYTAGSSSAQEEKAFPQDVNAQLDLVQAEMVKTMHLQQFLQH